MRYSEIVSISGSDIFKRHGLKKILPAGKLVAERGLPADRVAFIAGGRVRAFCLNSAGDEITLFYIDSGNMICTEALISHPSIITSLDAFTEVELYTMEADQFLNAWFETGHSVKALLAHFVRRILLLSDYLCCAHFTKNKERLAYFLHSARMDAAGSVAYTHKQIAAITGMSTVSVYRILKKLEEDEVIACKYRRIEVIDAGRLKNLFNSLGYLAD